MARKFIGRIGIILISLFVLFSVVSCDLGGSDNKDNDTDLVDEDPDAGTGDGDGNNSGSGNGDGSGDGNTGDEIETDVLWFVKQENSDAREESTATITNGVISLSSYYSASSNVYKAGDGLNYVNSNANFLAFPTKMSGDFSVEATITVDEQTKTGNASGIGIGMIEGFDADSYYGYVLMRNGNNTAQGYYTKGVANVGTGGISVTYAEGTEMVLKMERVGDQLTMSAVSSDGTTVPASDTTTWTGGVSNFIGCEGAVYAGLSFGNVRATVKNLTILDASGVTMFDSSLEVASIESLVPASISVSDSVIDIPLAGGSIELTTTAIAQGGLSADITISGHDESIILASVSGNTVAITPQAAGNTTLVITNSSDSSKFIEVSITVSDFASTDSYGSLTTTYPAVGEAAAYTDGELSITFDDTPVLNTGGTIRLYTTDGTQVDNINFDDDSQESWGSTINVGDQLVRVDGNTLYFTPHFDALEYGQSYYVAIPTTAITATLNGEEFRGLSNLSTVASWSFTTMADPGVSGDVITVDGAMDSTADFRTIQGALDYADSLGSDDITIDIAAGTYRELIYYKGDKNITIAGPDGNSRGDDCIIEYTNSQVMNASSHTRASFYFQAADLVIKNVTISNSFMRTPDTGDAQAEAIYFAASTGKLVAFNSTFKSYQDTIQTKGKNWFYDCYIEGDVDFIWGYADVALFEECDLKSLNDSNRSSDSNALFVARVGTASASTIGKGYVLLNSTVTVEDGITQEFGRTAGSGDFYDQVAVINTAVTTEGSASLISSLWRDDSNYSSIDSINVGWKDYNNTLNGTLIEKDESARLGRSASISETLYNAEYVGRYAIFNRVYNVTDEAYETVALPWDINTEYADFNASEDTSEALYTGGAPTPVTIEWDAADLTAGEIQGSTETIEGLVDGSASGVYVTVNATTGKLTDRGSDFQFNEGAIITVPVQDGSTVNVVGYPGYGNYTLNGVAAVDDNASYTHSGENGTVDIIATSGAYLYSFEVTNYTIE